MGSTKNDTTFGFYCTEEEKLFFDTEITKYAKVLGLKNGTQAQEAKKETFKTILKMAESGKDVYELKEAGVDTKALDAALIGIRRLFVSVSENKIAIEEEFKRRSEEMAEEHRTAEKKLSELAEKEKAEKRLQSKKKK